MLASKDPEVSARLAEIELVTSMESASQLVAEGKNDEAQNVLRQGVATAKEKGAALPAPAAADPMTASPAAESMQTQAVQSATSADGANAFIKGGKAGAPMLKKKQACDTEFLARTRLPRAMKFACPRLKRRFAQHQEAQRMRNLDYAKASKPPDRGEAQLMNVPRISIATLFVLLIVPPASAKDWMVRTAPDLRQALSNASHGDRVHIAPGDYPGGHYVTGINQLTVEALDPATPPRILGDDTGLQFSRCEGLTLRHLVISGQKRNGLNLDDGGERTRPVQGITLEHLEIRDIGPTGNHDGIKCSGLENLTIRDCTISGWGGQGIDFVGCHQSCVIGCQLIGKPGFSASAGIQLKGGTSDIVVERCRFQNAGQRPLNLGGSTGLDYFRPPGAKWEGRNLTVRDCVIEGGLCAAAFVGVDGGEFTGNTILFPEKWIFRILQETKIDGFIPCRNVRIADNRIIFRRAQVQVELNVGDHTAVETFVFSGNSWFAEDQPGRSQPKLPVEEHAGRYGSDPRR